MAIRVYQIAKEYSRTTAEVMAVLKEAGIKVASHTAPLDEHALHTVRTRFGKFKLTVVDGDQEAQMADSHPEPGVTKPEKSSKRKKKTAEAPPAPRLQVRVIKKHEEEKPKEAPVVEEEPVQAAPAEAHGRPKLRRKPRVGKLEERIHQLAEKRQHPDPAPKEEPKATADAAAPEKTAAAAEGDRDSDANAKLQQRKVKKREEKPMVLPERPSRPEPYRRNRDDRPQGRDDQSRGRYNNDRRPDSQNRPPRSAGAPQNQGPNRDRPQSGGYQNRDQGSRPGGYSQGGRPQGDRPGGPPQGGRPGGPPQGSRPGGPPQGSRPGGPPQGGRPGGPPQGGRPGGPPQGGRPGGSQGGGRPGYQGGGARPGGYQGGGRTGGYQGGGGSGGYQGGGGRPGGPPQGGGGRPGGPPQGGGGRPGGGYQGRPGGSPQGGGGRPGGSNFAQGSPMDGKAGAAAGNRPRYGAQRPFGKKKKKKRRNVEQIEKIKMVTTSKVQLPDEDLGIIMLSEGVTVKELSEKVDRKAKDIIKRLFEKGIMATLNDVLESELAIEIAKDFGYLAEIVSFEEDLQLQEDDQLQEEGDNDVGTEPRFPIVTIMGHVDHGKTTLLDAIRRTKVASDEAGGITQHIGAYSVPCKDSQIVFLDTPGHEAFTKMRARGASVTDIVILVVAADDGVKPQTIEAISHAKAAKVPIITCINKIDKPDANPERVKQMLTEHELIVEDFGGDSPCVHVSAKTEVGINDLLEMILLVAELQDYKANSGRRARGTVIEAKLDRGRGPVATLIVQDGTLKVGDYFITGQTYGKIRAMHDDMGKTVSSGGPSTPVEVLGLQEVPSAGDSFQVVSDEANARKVASFRKEKAREDNLHRQKHTSLDQLFSSLKQSEIKELSVIIKADVHGSVEGLVYALNKIESEKVKLRIVHQGVGNITENDVLLAVASDSIIIGFNVKNEPKAQSLAEHEGIDVRSYTVIYEVVKQMEAAMLGLVAPTLEERETGKGYVKQVFSVAKLGKVAGCYIESGFIKKNSHVRVRRGGNEIFTGQLETLKRFRDDVNEVKAGYECGIGIQGFSDIQEQDALEIFTFAEVHATEL